jgi:predicted kinase
MLVILSGLPGVGKTTIARELARSLTAVHLRIDSIEQALRRVGLVVEAEGYAVAHAVAADNLRAGLTVAVDCVNPWPLTRDEWRAVAEQMGVPVLEVEIICRDETEHRRRVESRVADIGGHRRPSWQDVVTRDYRPWDRPRLVIDTARQTAQESVDAIVSGLQANAVIQYSLTITMRKPLWCLQTTKMPFSTSSVRASPPRHPSEPAASAASRATHSRLVRRRAALDRDHFIRGG